MVGNIVTDQICRAALAACCAAGVRLVLVSCAKTADSARHRLALWLSLSPVSPIPGIGTRTNSPLKMLFTELACDGCLSINSYKFVNVGFSGGLKAHWPDWHPWGPGGAQLLVLSLCLLSPNIRHALCQISYMDGIIRTKYLNALW